MQEARTHCQNLSRLLGREEDEEMPHCRKLYKLFLLLFCEIYMVLMEVIGGGFFFSVADRRPLKSCLRSVVGCRPILLYYSGSKLCFSLQGN